MDHVPGVADNRRPNVPNRPAPGGVVFLRDVVTLAIGRVRGLDPQHRRLDPAIAGDHLVGAEEPRRAAAKRRVGAQRDLAIGPLLAPVPAEEVRAGGVQARIVAADALAESRGMRGEAELAGRPQLRNTKRPEEPALL